MSKKNEEENKNLISDSTTITGSIKGSLYKIIFPSTPPPKDSIQYVLIFMHGYRPKGIKLIAHIEERTMYEKVLKKGWIISALSYRREGYILEDAMEDVNLLRALILKKYLRKNENVRFVLDSRSMGGAISTLMSERYDQLYYCVFGIGSALYIDPIKEKRNNKKLECINFTFKPKLKILFLMNESEQSTVEWYKRNIKDEKYKKNIALYYVNRPGHCNVSDEEMDHSFFSLLEWANGVEIPLFHNVTKYTPLKSNVRFQKGGAFAKIDNIDLGGSIEVLINENELRKLGIRIGNTFSIITPLKETFEVLLGNFPFVGIKDNTMVAYLAITHIVIKRHAVKTIISTAPIDMKLKKGNEIFIMERTVKRNNKHSKNSHFLKLLKQFNNT